MSKTSFANLILSKLQGAVGGDGSKYSAVTSSLAQSAIAEAITEYLIANTTVNISYNGVLTSGGTDVIASDTMKIGGTCTPATVSDFTSWTAALQSSISSAFVVVPPSTQGVAVSFQPFNNVTGALQIPQAELTAAHNANPQSPTLAVWEVICGKILEWLNSSAGKNPSATAIAATRSGVSSGTATLLSIWVT